MQRLGLYGRDNGTLFEHMDDFFNESGFKSSMGALELISLNLKSQGKYNARALSFQDTTFKIEQVPLAEEFKSKYDQLVAVWCVLGRREGRVRVNGSQKPADASRASRILPPHLPLPLPPSLPPSLPLSRPFW